MNTNRLLMYANSTDDLKFVVSLFISAYDGGARESPRSSNRFINVVRARVFGVGRIEQRFILVLVQL